MTSRDRVIVLGLLVSMALFPILVDSYIPFGTQPQNESGDNSRTGDSSVPGVVEQDVKDSREYELSVEMGGWHGN